MQELEVKPGYACNNNCVFCLNQNKKHYKTFPLEQILGRIRSWAEKGCRRLIISGGEPLISPDFFTIMHCARDAGYAHVEIQTNARMLSYKAFLRRLLRIQPVKYVFLVSLHFPDRKLHNEYSRAEGFDQVTGGIRNLVKENLLFTVNTAVMKQNIMLLGKIAQLSRSLGVSRHQFRMIDGHNLRARYREYVPRLTEVSAAIRSAIDGNKDGLEFFIHEIPACVLGRDMEKYITAPVNPHRGNLSIGDRMVMLDEIMEDQFMFSLVCKRCSRRQWCRGVRRDYAELYGFDELKPLRYEKKE